MIIAQFITAAQMFYLHYTATYCLMLVVLTAIAGMLGMWLWVSCPYRQHSATKMSMSMHMLNGLPVVFVERTTYVVQF